VSRLSALAAHPRRTLGALAVVLAAVGITVGSGATFTAHSANPANTFTAGTLTMSNSKDAAVILSSGNMKPGDSTNGTVDIANTGSVAGNFKLSTSNVSDANGLLTQLDLKIEDCGLYSGTTAPSCSGAASVYTGKASAFTTAAQLGSFASSAKHRYQFTVTMPSTISDTYQGKTGSVQFDWDAVTA
jgi:spore coat-associated protein N